MLDEILEYEQYSWDVKHPDRAVYRLKYRTLNKELSGISRAMTLIARKALFQDVEDYASLSPEKQRQRTDFARDCLRAWCGDGAPQDFEDMKGVTTFSAQTGNDEEPDSGLEVKPAALYNWFPDYLNCLQAKKNKDLKKISGKFEERRSAFSGSLSKEMPGDQNDYHALTYDRIIATALRQGPLKRYYLAAEQSPFDEKARGKSAEKIPCAHGVVDLDLGGSRSDVRRSQKDLLLKLMAAYLLSDRRMQYAKANAGVYGLRKVNKADVTNWWTNDNLQPESESKISKLHYKNQPVFHEELKGGNVVVMKPQQAFMDDFGWHLIEEADLLSEMKEHPDWIWYQDQGSGEPLKALPVDNSAR